MNSVKSLRARSASCFNWAAGVEVRGAVVTISERGVVFFFFWERRWLFTGTSFDLTTRKCDDTSPFLDERRFGLHFASAAEFQRKATLTEEMCITSSVLVEMVADEDASTVVVSANVAVEGTGGEKRRATLIEANGRGDGEGAWRRVDGGE